VVSLRKLPHSSLLAGAALAAATTVGCASEIDPYTVDADTGSTHALITVERSTPAGGAGLIRGGVLAGFVRIPPTLESKRVMREVGLSGDFPAVGHCRAASVDRETMPSSRGYVEFMGGGDIRLQTALGTTQLSPRAFPTITDLISGVVYTTRDRSADTLPAGARYAISASGNGSVPALNLEAEAPRELESVLLGGIPLAEVETISTSTALDFNWLGGDAGDMLVFEFAADGSPAVLCSSRDDAGGTTLPPGIVQATGPGRLSIHRVRTREFIKPGIDRGELRFHFTVRANLNFAR
jgi:hypothetical protein